MAPPSERSPAPPASPGPSSATVLAAVALVGVAAVVFLVLPRWNVEPVVITSAPSSSPPTTPATVATPEPVADPPEPDLPVEPPARSAESGRAVEGTRPSVPTADPLLREFDAAVSEGLAALDRAAPADARAAFTRAESLRPGTEVVKDGLARSEAGLRGEALEAHRRRAQAAEAAEDWKAALKEYEAALRLEPAVRFAVEGALRAGQRAEAEGRLDFYLRRPDRLATDEVAREAEIALDRASEIDSPGPKLLRQIEHLRAALGAAGATVTVRLLSDERTDVSVLRVGPLGRFREKSLALRPGSYVVLGTRRGYRDARHTLVVAPGRSPEPLTVRCDEVL